MVFSRFPLPVSTRIAACHDRRSATAVWRMSSVINGATPAAATDHSNRAVGAIPFVEVSTPPRSGPVRNCAGTGSSSRDAASSMATSTPAAVVGTGTTVRPSPVYCFHSCAVMNRGVALSMGSACNGRGAAGSRATATATTQTRWYVSPADTPAGAAGRWRSPAARRRRP